MNDVVMHTWPVEVRTPAFPQPVILMVSPSCAVERIERLVLWLGWPSGFKSTELRIVLTASLVAGDRKMESGKVVSDYAAGLNGSWGFTMVRVHVEPLE